MYSYSYVNVLFKKFEFITTYQTRTCLYDDYGAAFELVLCNIYKHAAYLNYIVFTNYFSVLEFSALVCLQPVSDK